MKYKRLTPMLWTEDLQASIAFYTQILGFTCAEFNEEWQWAALQLDAIELMLAKPNQHMPYDKIGFTGSFYIEVDDVETLWHHLKNKATVVYELETFNWGMKEFAIKDNNGYMLQFGQNMRHE
ncbi:MULTISPECIES: VOC family protein [unclassified Flavobacterium]|uniref:VOC family protein n=1 Tax=unclassified Flavobacterium TaxID=196869 RepID=UPI0013D44F25|nr:MULTISPECIES: VOC family protein [unclassified Flavobacterium]MBA5792492.1 VOC family protein [Flavobacterium sp. xlx-221]